MAVFLSKNDFFFGVSLNGNVSNFFPCVVDVFQVVTDGTGLFFYSFFPELFLNSFESNGTVLVGKNSNVVSDHVHFLDFFGAHRAF